MNIEKGIPGMKENIMYFKDIKNILDRPLVK